jgi:hypothetical protein
VSVLKKITKEYKKNGLGSVCEKAFTKVVRNSKVKRELTLNPPNYLQKEEVSPLKPSSESISTFQNKFKGKRCFIIGNGPSLNKISLERLQDEYTFAVNGIFYKTDETGFVPSFYMVEDSHVIADNLEKINLYQPKIHRFFPTEYKETIKDHSKTSFFTMNRGFYEKSSPNFQVPRFSTDFSLRGFCGQSVTILNLQLAYYMGFSEVYLIGMDFSYNIPKSAIVEGTNIESTEDDENHFHPDYFGKGKKWHDPQLEQVLKNYEMAKYVFNWSGRTILNATEGGNLNIFDRVDYKSLF